MRAAPDGGAAAPSETAGAPTNIIAAEAGLNDMVRSVTFHDLDDGGRFTSPVAWGLGHAHLWSISPVD